MNNRSRLYKKAEDYVRCLICAHKCKIKNGKTGVCRTIANENGVLYSLNYGIIGARGIDPIEKKPLFHFMPASYSYSIASPGCNFRCLGCQNADLSQTYRDDKFIPYRQHFSSFKRVSPNEVVNEAIKSGCGSISYTYTDPSVFFDYSLDVMEIAHKKGLKNVFVTNGYFTEESSSAVIGLLDAANIDIKFFSDESYRRICGGTLEPVLETIKFYYSKGIHLEITTLLIDGYNSKEEEIKSIAGFISSVDINILWHISRFFPSYKMSDVAPTSKETINNAYKIGKDAGLNYVYAGNIRIAGYEDTACPACGRILIERGGYSILQNLIGKDGACKFCGYKIYGVF